ncbi:serine hydrolase domain-containing protein [Pedobacter nyackensis]|uniref:serine hydrolase domain-containing protein n=1 Tax=Pedobacter nyackensis TaxID=475255 RepID=UPI00292D99E7|nr:serine hydrolase domain-containing protein [Pedobacter nyackensis]
MKKTCLLLAAVYLIVINQANAFRLITSDSLEMTVDLIMSKHSGTDKPGATIGILKDDKLIFQKGYGMANLRSHQKNGSKVFYNLASGSKQFTAFTVASLIQQKKLALTDSIGKFLPEFPAYGKAITIGNLLYHTSGIRDYMVLMWLTGQSFEDKFNNKNALNIIFRQSALNFSPGERCVYSNSNYILLAEIIERVTGLTLAANVHDLLKNININANFGTGNMDREAAYATSYFRWGTSYLPYKDNFSAYGDAGILATIEDLAKWDSMFYDGNSLVQYILKRGTLNNGNILNYGMGIILGTYRNEVIQTHAGAFLGFRSETLRFPEKRITIICLGNAEEINPESITRSIADNYVFKDTKLGTLSEAKAQNDMIIVRPEKAAPVVGIYQVAPNVFIRIRYEDGAITGQIIGQPKQILYADGNNAYRVGTTKDRVVFDDLMNGKYQQLTIIQNNNHTTAQRSPLLSQKHHSRYTGHYYSKEQNATYDFYSKDGDLWFKVGKNVAMKAEVLTSYNRIYFGYKNLESATIDFQADDNGNINGFVLNSGRVRSIHFMKKKKYQ